MIADYFFSTCLEHVYISLDTPCSLGVETVLVVIAAVFSTIRVTDDVDGEGNFVGQHVMV